MNHINEFSGNPMQASLPSKLTTIVLVYALPMAVVSGLLFISISELNPDWLSYEEIYLSDGRWLMDTNRDQLFVLINRWAYAYFGASGYETFRIFLAACLLCFSFSIILGILIPLTPRMTNANAVAWLFATIFYLGMRVAIQVREGLALVFLLSSVALLSKLGRTSARETTRALEISIAVLCGLCAITIHLSTVILIAAAMAFVAIESTKQNLALYGKLRIVAIAIGYACCLGLLMQMMLGSSVGVFINEKGGDRDVSGDASAVFQLSKLAMHLALGHIAYRAAIIFSPQDDNRPNGLLDYSAFIYQALLLPMVCLTATLIISDYSKLVVGDFVRLCYSIVSLQALLVAAQGRLSISASFVLAFLVAEQVRSTIIAVYVTHGEIWPPIEWVLGGVR